MRTLSELVFDNCSNEELKSSAPPKYTMDVSSRDAEFFPASWRSPTRPGDCFVKIACNDIPVCVTARRLCDEAVSIVGRKGDCFAKFARNDTTARVTARNEAVSIFGHQGDCFSRIYAPSQRQISFLVKPLTDLRFVLDKIE